MVNNSLQAVKHELDKLIKNELGGDGFALGKPQQY